MRKKNSKCQIVSIKSLNFVQFLQLQSHKTDIKVFNEFLKAVYAVKYNSNTCLAVVSTSE